MLDDPGQFSQLPVATMTQPPQIPPYAPPPPPPPSDGSPWRLAGLVAVVVALVLALAGTQAAALAATRNAAYPRPAISVTMGGTTPYRVGTAIPFTVNATAGRDLTYAWDFGDEQAGTGASASHTYTSYGTYTVTATGRDPIGQIATAQQSIRVLPLPPTACFNAAADPQDPFTFTFDASCSNGTQLSYSWAFGDGSTSDEGPQTSYQYQQQGTFTVTLTVTDVANQSASTTNSVTVSIPAPHASFTYQISSNDGYYACYDFDASASSGYNLSYSWSFGDGYSGYGETAGDCYYTGSSYTVTLTVTDGIGQTDSTAKTINA